MAPAYGDGPDVRNATERHRSAQPPASSLVGQSRRRRSLRQSLGEETFMASAVPVRDDLAQPATPARHSRSWMTQAPAIVRFDRGRRLGHLAAAAGRKRSAATETQLTMAAEADLTTVDATSSAGVGGNAASGGVPAGGRAAASRAAATRAAATRAAATAGHAAAACASPASAAAGVRTEGGAAASPGAAAGVGAGGRGGAGSRRRRVLVAAGAVGAVGMLAVPLPAGAAPAPCEQAERYAAQSGSQILRLNALGAADGKPASEIHVGDAKSAMVAQAPVSSAAVARMIDAVGAPEGLSEALQQQAPPTNNKPNRRATGAADTGPISLGDGTLTTHAQWEAGMACGATDGEVTRATARLRDAGILADGDSALVRVPGKVESESTTEVERHGAAVATVASAGLEAGTFELLDGAVKVAIRKAPSLRASMSMKDGGEVRYIPATVEVSGEGFKTERLDTAGDEIEVTLHEPTKEATSEESGTAPSGLLGALGKTRLLGGGDGAPLPGVPELPQVTEPRTETAPVVEPGTKVRISLGEVRQAARGRAIAARASALSVTITQGGPDDRTKPGYGGSDAAVLDFDMGVLEAAAVAPETAGGVSGAEAAGEGGGLPITGPRVDVIALSGVALLIAGTAALIFGMRGRSRS
ncbi:hypothetical protein [Actinoplanes sp. NPDC049316]|uniref:hypothetical protein n=1 Tax=Actinoplanes sp. NPDC049316 TaxID=3154727 RepID=UPI0034188361